MAKDRLGLTIGSVGPVLRKQKSAFVVDVDIMVRHAPRILLGEAIMSLFSPCQSVWSKVSNLPPNKDELDDDNRGNRLSVDDTHAEQEASIRSAVDQCTSLSASNARRSD